MKSQENRFPKPLDVFFQIVIIYSLTVFTFEPVNIEAGSFFYYSDLVVSIIFSVEYVTRIILAPDKFRYLKSFGGIIDFLASIPYILTMGILDLKFLRIMRLLRVIRIFKLIRYSKAMDRLKYTFMDIRDELIIFFSLSFSLIYLSAVGINYFEHGAQPEKFGTVADCMWWSIATLSTVGYGDVFPITFGGKVFTGVLLLIGLSIISIPSGLIASSFIKNAR